MHTGKDTDSVLKNSSFWMCILMIASVLYGCSHTKQEEKIVKHVREGLPVQESWDVTYLYSDSGKITARLEAPYLREMKNTENPDQTELEMNQGVRLVIINRATGAEDSHLTSKYARINQQTGIAEARDSVVVLNSEGAKLETEQLFWYREQDQIKTDKFVKITTRDEILFGEGMVANSGFNTYKIFKIRGTLSVKE
jgi:LPS export ABC transporter protein LptC